jgi:hypothetical protein
MPVIVCLPLCCLHVEIKIYEVMIACTDTRSVSIKYWNNLRTRQSIFLVLDLIVHFSNYMLRPHLAAIFRWFANTKISKAVTIYSTDPLSRYV